MPGTITGVAVLRLIGDFDISDRDTVTRSFSTITHASPIIIDFGKVTYMDSTMLGCLVHLRKEMFTVQGAVDIRLCNIPEQPRRILDICRFEQAFTIEDSCESAIPPDVPVVEVLLQASEKEQAAYQRR